MSHARLRIALAAVLSLAVAGCNKDPVSNTNPKLAGISVQTSTDTDTLVTGDTALITFRFSNAADTAVTLTSKVIDTSDGKQCPVLLPVAAYPGTQTVYSFILSTCFGGTDTTLTGRYGLQNITIPAHGTIERTVPFTGYTRSSPTATPRCLTPGKQWILPLFLIDNQFVLPSGSRDTDQEALLFLKAPTVTPAPCTSTTPA